jgi:hypothetical protein
MSGWYLDDGFVNVLMMATSGQIGFELLERNAHGD